MSLAVEKGYPTRLQCASKALIQISCGPFEEMTNDEEKWQGGHMSSTAGRVVRTPDRDLPYKVVLTHEDDKTSEHAFASMREAEAFIKRNTPKPPERDRSRDRTPGTA